jgi:AcrR family transcriptional regulator
MSSGFRGRQGTKESSSRERILNAAAELVREVGSGRLTLEAVAERAGLSKGGLLYNFPSKDALLQGMIERMMDEVSAEKEALRGTLQTCRNLEARLGAAASLKTRCGAMREVANGMLAASAENPRLLEPVRQVIKKDWQTLRSTSEDPAAAMIAWLAIEGLSSLEMHGLSPVTPSDREEIVAAVYKLLDKGIAG